MVVALAPSLPQYLSAHTLGLPLPPEFLVFLSRGSGTGWQVYIHVLHCLPWLRCVLAACSSPALLMPVRKSIVHLMHSLS